MQIKTILVVDNEPAKTAYLSAIQNLGVKVDTVPSFEKLYLTLRQHRYSGVLVDLVTKIKTPRKYLDLMQEVMEQFPVVQLRYEEKSDVVNALYLGASDGGGLESFFKSECLSFVPRKIRSSDHRKVNFNVILSPVDTGRKKNALKSIRTVTLDISAGGCFLLTTENVKIGQNVVLKIKEIEDQAPITGVVRWQRAWGQYMDFPGVGVMFKKIKDSQRKELLKLR
jgi:Tfp pilus assembly protein PilZ